MTAFKDVMAEAFHLANRPTATVELSKAIRAIEDPPELETDELEQLLDTERRLLLRLAETAPITGFDLVLKAEAAVRRLLKSIEDGDQPEEIALGRAALRDLQASVCAWQAAESALPQ